MKFLKLPLDLLNALLALLLAPLTKLQARLGPMWLPRTFRVWDMHKISPVSHQYYQPVFDVHTLPDHLWVGADEMVGVNLNEDAQLALLRSFSYQDEMRSVPTVEQSGSLLFYHNQSYGPADAEILYNMVRHFKPERVIEIGSGYSTRMMKQALDRNRQEGRASSHVCIEPYEMPWLESLGLDQVVRKKVEDVPLELFDSLERNDILFIDSSHVIRTGGDVLFEFLKILPRLKPGVIVHIHDIFLPYEYPREWLVARRRYWTEQYLLQAFLAFNSQFEVLAAVHWLAKTHHDALANACPVYSEQKRGHGAFWIRRI